MSGPEADAGRGLARGRRIASVRGLAVIGGVVLALLITLVSVTVAATPSLPPYAMTVTIDIHYSHYQQTQVEVPAGMAVRFVIQNLDPIDHEWIVGDAAVHAAHRTGTELRHAARPTEVSIPAGQTVETVVTFSTTGSLPYICHLPGHEAYGMVGAVVVK